MHKDKTPAEIEKMLEGLMPVSLSSSLVEESEASFDRLAKTKNSHKALNRKREILVLTSCIVTLLVLGGGALMFNFFYENSGQKMTELSFHDLDTEFVFLEKEDRIEEVHDEGLFINSDGTPVRRIRVRMIGEQSLRDEATGIVMELTEPREETYLVPVTKF
ncbi:MAG: hypothetical protein AB8D78_11530 [Akkermansiaceae bacterium]